MSPFTKEALEAQAQHWREEAERHRRARWLQGLIGLIALGGLISFTLWYVAHTQTVSDQRWCDLMTSIDKRNQQIKGASPDQQEFINKIHDLTQRLHC